MSPQTISPVPASGLPAGVEAGPLGGRFGAYLIDLVVPAVIASVCWLLITRADNFGAAAVVYFVGWGLCLVWFVVVWWMFATKAAGPGMRLLKLQLVGLRNGRPIGWGRYFVRALVLSVLTATVVGLVILLILLVRQPRRQGLHDLVIDSVVIKARPLAPTRRAPARAEGSAPKEVAAPAPSPSPSPSRTPVPPAPVPDPVAAQVLPPPPHDSVRVRPRKVAPGPTPEAPSETHPLPSLPDDGRPLDLGWVAVLDDGREVHVSGLVLLGRNPQPRPGEEDAELIKVADDTRTVSKTHLSLSVDASGLFVMDRGSTNGTTLTGSSGESQPCPAGDVVPASDGIVSFGDHWLRIERRSGEGSLEG